jgi:hypothetical protein
LGGLHHRSIVRQFDACFTVRACPDLRDGVKVLIFIHRYACLDIAAGENFRFVHGSGKLQCASCVASSLASSCCPSSAERPSANSGNANAVNIFVWKNGKQASILFAPTKPHPESGSVEHLKAVASRVYGKM